MNYSPYASHVNIYLGFIASTLFVCIFVLASHTATFLGEPVAHREVASRPITALALGGPKPFLRLLLHNEGWSLVFVGLFVCFIIRSDNKAEVRFELCTAACLVTFGK